MPPSNLTPQVGLHRSIAERLQSLFRGVKVQNTLKGVSETVAATTLARLVAVVALPELTADPHQGHQGSSRPAATAPSGRAASQQRQMKDELQSTTLETDALPQDDSAALEMDPTPVPLHHRLDALDASTEASLEDRWDEDGQLVTPPTEPNTMPPHGEPWIGQMRRHSIPMPT